MSKYNFVVLRGKLTIVTDPEERAEVIRRMATAGKEKLSTNFLAAHGFKIEEGWSSFAPGRPMVIVRLEGISEEIGIKSP